MASFLNDVLSGLQGLYRFPGGVVKTDQLDLGGVTLVHDVSREVELGQNIAYYGYDNFSMVNTHTVPGGEVESSQSFAKSASFWASTGADFDKDWVWLLEASLKIGSGLTFVAGSLAIAQIVVPVGLTTHRVPTHYWTAKQARVSITAEAFYLNSQPGNIVPCPRLIPNGSTVYFHTDASGAAEAVTAQLLCWIGRKGVRPPGLR